MRCRLRYAQQIGDLQLAAERRARFAVGDRLEAVGAVARRQAERHVAGDDLPGRAARLQRAPSATAAAPAPSTRGRGVERRLAVLAVRAR